MAINPLIALQGDMSQIYNPVKAQILNNQAQVGQAQVAQLQNQVAQQPLENQALQQKVDMGDQALQQEHLKNALAHTEAIGQLANGVTDQASWEKALDTAKGLGIDTTKLDGQPYSPQLVNTVKQQALSVKDQLTLQAQNPFMQLGGDNHGALGNTSSQHVETAPEDYIGRIKQLPSVMQPTVQAIIEGRMKGPDVNSRAPGAQVLVQAVNLADPNYDFADSSARVKTRVDATSGGLAKSNNALNTVAGHLQNLAAAYDALGNTSIPMVNSVKNGFENAIGNPQVNNLNIAKQAVADELSKAYKGGVVSDAEAHKWDSVLSANASPEQSAAALKEIADLLQSKLQANNEQYKKGMGIAYGNSNFILPQSQKVFDKLLGKADTAQAQTGAAGGGFAPEDIQAELQRRGLTK